MIELARLLGALLGKLELQDVRELFKLWRDTLELLRDLRKRP